MTYGLQEIFLNKVLDNYFVPKDTTLRQHVKIALGLSTNGGQANTNDFIEPSESAGYERQYITFGEAEEGISKNANAIVFGPATADWTSGTTTIDRIGIFYMPDDTTETQELWCVLPLDPTESVLSGESVVINANSIRLQLTNR